MKLLWICVNYRSYFEAGNFLHSLAAQCQGLNSLKIILVDNSPEAEAPSEFAALLAETGLDIQWIRTGENLGYFGAVNRAILAYPELAADSDWLVVSNVDLELRDQKFFANLANKDYRSTHAILAPAIRSLSSGRNLNPQMKSRPSGMRMAFYAAVFANYWAQNLYNSLSWIKHYIMSVLRSWFGHKKEVGELNIYAAHGSCIIFSREFLKHGGHFSYPSFLFNEEIFLAEMAIELGLVIRYTPDLEIWDFEHVGTGNWHNRRIANWVGESSKYVYCRYWKNR